MSSYFDKDFLKFLIAFAAIVLISCAIIVAIRVYESRSSGPSSLQTTFRLGANITNNTRQS